MKKFAVGFVALSFGALVAGVAYLWLYLDRNLEGMLSAALEREVRIEKGVSVHWSLSPGITLHSLWIGNPEWTRGEYLARAEQATLRLNLAGLWHRRLELDQIRVQHADVALELAADGRQNWQFGEASGAGPWLMIDELRIEHSHLAYRSPDGAEYRTDIADITYTDRADGAPAVEARFSYQKAQIRVSTANAEPRDLRNGGWPLTGRVEVPDRPAIEMAAQLEITDCCLQLRRLAVTSDNSDISGELGIPLRRGGRIDGTLNSNALDLRPYLGRSEKPAGNAKPLLELELPSDSLKGFDAAVQLKVGRLLFPTLELEQVDVSADLQNGHLSLKVRAENKRIVANVDLKPLRNGWQFALYQKGKMNIAELIGKAQQGRDDTRAPLETEMRLKGTGSSLAGMLRSAQGQFLMVVGKGKLSKEVSSYLPLGSVLYTLLGAILPQGKNGQETQLECAVAQLDIARGIATSSKGLALRTGQLNVLGGGAINLQTGAIRLRFKTAPRRGFGVSFLGVADRLFDVTGTLRKPTVALSMERTVTYGAMAWATSGLTILADSILSRLSASTNPCETVLQAAKQPQGLR